MDQTYKQRGIGSTATSVMVVGLVGRLTLYMHLTDHLGCYLHIQLRIAV